MEYVNRFTDMLAEKKQEREQRKQEQKRLREKEALETKESLKRSLLSELSDINDKISRLKARQKTAVPLDFCMSMDMQTNDEMIVLRNEINKLKGHQLTGLFDKGMFVAGKIWFTLLSLAASIYLAFQWMLKAYGPDWANGSESLSSVLTIAAASVLDFLFFSLVWFFLVSIKKYFSLERYVSLLNLIMVAGVVTALSGLGMYFVQRF